MLEAEAALNCACACDLMVPPPTGFREMRFGDDGGVARSPYAGRNGSAGL